MMAAATMTRRRFWIIFEPVSVPVMIFVIRESIQLITSITTGLDYTFYYRRIIVPQIQDYWGHYLDLLTTAILAFHCFQ